MPLPLLFVAIGFIACSNHDIDEEAKTICLDGSKVVVETTGLQNDESVYWGEKGNWVSLG